MAGACREAPPAERSRPEEPGRASAGADRELRSVTPGVTLRNPPGRDFHSVPFFWDTKEIPIRPGGSRIRGVSAADDPEEASTDRKMLPVT